MLFSKVIFWHVQLNKCIWIYNYFDILIEQYNYLYINLNNTDMGWPVPIVEKIKWVYPPASSTSQPLNVQFNNKLNDLSKELQNNKIIINNLTTYSQIYAQKFAGHTQIIHVEDKCQF